MEDVGAVVVCATGVGLSASSPKGISSTHVARGKDLDAVTAGEAMTSRMIPGKSSDTVHDAASQIFECGIRHVPVLSDTDELIGTGVHPRLPPARLIRRRPMRSRHVPRGLRVGFRVARSTDHESGLSSGYSAPVPSAAVLCDQRLATNLQATGHVRLGRDGSAPTQLYTSDAL